MSIVDDILADVATSASGHQEFGVTTPKGDRPIRINITPELLSTDGLLKFRTSIASIAGWKKASSPPAWHPFLPDEGSLSDDVCRRIAAAKSVHAEIADIVEVDKEGKKVGEPVYAKIGDLDLLKLAAKAGPFFIPLTDEISYRLAGFRATVEVEALDDMGEGSTSTDSDEPS